MLSGLARAVRRSTRGHDSGRSTDSGVPVPPANLGQDAPAPPPPLSAPATGLPPLVASSSTSTLRSSKRSSSKGLDGSLVGNPELHGAKSMPQLHGMRPHPDSSPEEAPRPGKPPKTPGSSRSTGEKSIRSMDSSRSMQSIRSNTPENSPGTTPRTPRTLEIEMEGQEWTLAPFEVQTNGDVFLKAPQGQICSLALKVTSTGKTGSTAQLQIPIHFGERVDASFLRNSEALKAERTVEVVGAQECEFRLATRSDGSFRMPKPGHSHFELPNSSSSTKPGRILGREVSPEEALALTAVELPSLEAKCIAKLVVNLAASVIVTASSQAILRAELTGRVTLRPCLHLSGFLASVDYYQMARESFLRGALDEALVGAERALAAAGSLEPRPQKEIGDILNLMGAAHLRRKNAGLAVTCLQGALSARTKGLESTTPRTPAQSASVAATLSTLGSAHQAAGNLDLARDCLEQAIALLATIPQVGGAALGSAYQTLGGIYRLLGHLEQACDAYEAAISAREAAVGKDHVSHAATLNNLGIVLQQRGLYQRAWQCYERALHVQVKTHGRKHISLAGTLNNLGSVHTQLKDNQVAVACHIRALELQEAQLGSVHVDVATTLHNLGNALASLGLGSSAVGCLWRALEIWSKTVGTGHPEVGSTLFSLGNVYRGMEQRESACQCFVGALKIREANLGLEHPETARTRHCLTLLGLGASKLDGIGLGFDGEESAQELEAIVEDLTSSLGADHRWTLQARADLDALKQAYPTPCSTARTSSSSRRASKSWDGEASEVGSVYSATDFLVKAVVAAAEQVAERLDQGH